MKHAWRNDVYSLQIHIVGVGEKVELRGAGNPFIEQTGSESLTVEAEKSVVPEIETENLTVTISGAGQVSKH